MDPDVSIIIVNYQTENLVIDCVNSIRRQSDGIKYEIIIVDNGSIRDLKRSELSEDFVALEKDENIRIIKLKENIGFGRANNKGWNEAKGRNILFLNPDTLLLNNAIKILSDFLDSNSKTGACGGNLYNIHFQPSYSHQRIFPGIKWEINELLNHIPQKIFFGSNYRFNNRKSPLKVTAISGADLMIKKKILEASGGFDKDYFMYFEDTDICKRIHDQGWEIFNVPFAKIQHIESGSFQKETHKPSEQKIKLFEESKKIYYSKNKSRTGRRISKIIYNIFLTSRILLVKEKRKKDYYKIRKFYFLNGDKEVVV